jgi:hypothetical protein
MAAIEGIAAVKDEPDRSGLDVCAGSKADVDWIIESLAYVIFLN